MIAKSKELYRQMENELDKCRKEYSTATEQTEKSFLICELYWSRIREELVNYIFPTAADEIEFFKNIKPLFTARAAYYSLLYQAAMFIPENNENGKLVNFWMQEKKRFDRYVQGHEAFYEYYKEKRTEKDKYYFLRHKANLAATGDDFKTIEMKSSTVMDRIIAVFLSLELYKKYAEDQLALITG